MSSLLAILVALTPAFLPSRPEAPPASAVPVATIQAVRELTPEQAAEKRPVRLTGVVTHFNPHLGDLFFDDGTAGIYVQPQTLLKSLNPGDRIELEGVTDPGEFAPCLRASALKKVGAGPLPDPHPFDLSLDDSRWLDGQWVQVWALVRAVRVWHDYTVVEVGTEKGTAEVCIPGVRHREALAKLAQASVRVRGVCAPQFDDHRYLAGPPRIYAQSPGQIVVVRRKAEELQLTPPMLIDHLRRFSPDPHPGSRRVKVAGVVTARWEDRTLFLQDKSAGLALWLETPEDVAVGTQIEAVGFVGFQRGVLGSVLLIHAAHIKRLGTAPLPAPVEALPREARAKRQEAVLFRVTGRIDDVQERRGSTILGLHDGATKFEAFLPKGVPAPELEVGSRVRLTGVFTTAPLFGQANEGFALILRTPDDVAVLELPPRPPQPSWWTPERVAGTLGALAALGAAGLVWVATLRARVSRQTAQIREHFERAGHLEAQLRQAQKLEAVGRLAGGIAHDFNNLLTVINGCADLLKGSIPPASSEATLVGDIATAGERAAALTNQLLMFSRKRAIACTAVDLNQAIAEADALLRRVIGETITIERFPGENLPPILADPGLIHQVIFNLAVNARDAMPRGGTLVLATLRALDTAGNPMVRLLVSDTGCGMDEATQTHLFEPFFTTKDVGQGTGLGLATVYGIVQSLGGTIRFRSALDRGTVFEVDFPAADVPVVAPAPGESAATGPLRPLTVLLVEDDAAVRDLARRLLESRGNTVLVCDSPEQALDTAARYEGGIDLLVTDVVMPHMNGRELAETLQRDRPSLKVLFMSGYTSDEVLRRGVLSDEVAFLQKPFKAGTFLARVRQVMQPEGPEQPSEAKDQESEV